MKRVCAWCDLVIEEGPDDNVSHGICVNCLPSVADMAVADMAGLSQRELDSLPYGVIRLDAEGRVLAYNAEEARIARLDQKRVVGRLFFEEIAPCTNVKELAGWFDEARRAGRTDTKRLSFVFDFEFGRELVELALTYESATGTSHVLVRTRQQQATEA